MVWAEAGSTALAGWNQRCWPLRQHSGRTIAATDLGFASASAVDGYAVNVGELRLDGAVAAGPPERPSGFGVEQAHLQDGTATVFLAWRLAPAGVWHYDLLRVGAAGREWLGRVYDEVSSCPAPSDTGTEPRTTLQLIAVSPAGTRSAPAVASFAWT